MKHLLSALWATAGILVASQSMAQIVPAKFDVNENMVLDPNELNNLKSAVDVWPDEAERTHYHKRLAIAATRYPNGAPVPVPEITVYTPTRTCTPNTGRFVLRRRISDRSITGCQQVDAAGERNFDPHTDGASLSYARDNIANTTEIAFHGAVGYVFPGPQGTGSFPAGGSVSDWGYALFLEADGTRNSLTADNGTVRLGLKAEYVFSAPGLSALELSMLGYAQSDLDLDGRAYGLQASLTPYSASNHINSSFRDKGESDYVFIFKPTLDAFHVDKIGTSGLTSNTDYYWLGGEIGLEFFLKGVLGQGIKASFGAHTYWDLESGTEAIDAYAKADLFLNEAKTAAVRFDYRHGKPRTTLIDRETFTVGIALAF